jgi:hypothetical protein
LQQLEAHGKNVGVTTDRPPDLVGATSPTEPNTLHSHEPGWLPYAIGLWVAGIFIFHLGCAATGRSLYRDIHLGTALEYAQGSINLLRPVIVGFNLNGAPTPQEFPLWQGAAGLVMKVCGTWFGWANLVSLLFFCSCLYPFFKLAQRFSGTAVARWSLLLFLAQPLTFLYAGEASPDGMSLASAIWFLHFAVRLSEQPQLKWLCLTTLLGSLAAVSKLPFFLAAGLACFFLVLQRDRRRLASWVWLGVAAAAIGLVFTVWSHYVNRCYEQAEMPFVDLRLSSPGMKFWYFGDLHYRFSPGVWARGGWRSLTALFGSFALAGLFLFGLCRRPTDLLARNWLLGAGVTTLIFFQIVLRHSHYYLMFGPAVAILAARAAERVYPFLFPAGCGRWLGPGVTVIALGLATLQGITGMHLILNFDRYPAAMAALIKAHTKPSDKLLIQGGGWGGELLFLSGRQGLSIWDTKPFEDRDTYARLKQKGFTKLVMISESPLLTSIQHSTSASATFDRRVYPSATTPVIDPWPTLLRNEDILIKELP